MRRGSRRHVTGGKHARAGCLRSVTMPDSTSKACPNHAATHYDLSHKTGTDSNLYAEYAYDMYLFSLASELPRNVSDATEPRYV